jgi:HK97 family phage prohead protease
MDMIYKTIKGEVSKEEDGSLNIYIPVSSKEWDRSEEVLEPTAFKKTLPKFKQHPVLIASHDYGDLEKQIGEWTSLKITENGLEGKPKYYVNQGNSIADWAFNLASKNMAAFSVGFIPKEWEDGDGKKTPRRTYKDVELLEISQCSIPSNRQSIMGMMAKSVDPIVKSLCAEVLKDFPEEVTKPETTENTIRIPVDSGDHTGHKMRTIEISAKEGISALYCVNDKKVLTYIFDKEKWDMEKAKKWVSEHKSFNAEKEVSQNEILDEIDYLTELIKENGMNDTVKESFKSMVEDNFNYINLGNIVATITANNDNTISIKADTTEVKNNLEKLDVIQPTKEAVKENNIDVTPKVTIIPEKVTEPTNQEILDELNKVEV